MIIILHYVSIGMWLLLGSDILCSNFGPLFYSQILNPSPYIILLTVPIILKDSHWKTTTLVVFVIIVTLLKFLYSLGGKEEAILRVQGLSEAVII